MLDTPNQIEFFRLLTLRQMLKLELLGMKRSGKSAYSIIKQETGLKGSRQSVYEQFSKLLGKDWYADRWVPRDWSDSMAGMEVPVR